MTDGVLLDGAGKIVAIVHGRSDKANTPTGQTFRALDSVVGLSPGMVAPTEGTQQLAASDHEMARGVEDLIAALIAKGTITKTDLPAPLLAKINQRRALRGEAAL